MFLSLSRSLHHELSSSDTLRDVEYLRLASLMHLENKLFISVVLGGFR